MRSITEYRRPADLAEALGLINRAEVASVLVGGGTAVSSADLPLGTEAIDLQDAVGSNIELQDGRLSIGGMARIHDVAISDLVPPLIAELAGREGPSTIRNAATIGGTIAAADWESELLAGLIVHEADVTIARPDGPVAIALDVLLSDLSSLVGGIVTSVSLEAEGQTASARTGRTPADTPIVAAVGRVVTDGFRIALTGVAATPVCVDPADLSAINPPGDFRGSPEYRKELARVLTDRVVAALGGAA